MSLVGLQGQGSFLARDLSVLQPELSGGLLSVLMSTQSRSLCFSSFNQITNDFSVADSHGQIFHFRISDNSYQLVRLGGDAAVTSMSFLHSKLTYLAVAYDDGSIVVVDLKKRKGVASMETMHQNPIRMLRCHPTKSILVGLGVSPTGQCTLDMYDLKSMIVVGSMALHEMVIDIKFASVKNMEGKVVVYIAVLFEESGVVFYNPKDCSTVITCPFPMTERMPKWTAFTILDTTHTDDNTGPYGGGLDSPAFRFVTAGANSQLYLWESPTHSELIEYAHEKEVGMCSMGGIIDMPLNVKQAVFMQTLGDASVNNETYRLLLTTESGAASVIDISGLAHRDFGVQGMWTVVSDLSNAQVVGSAATKVSGDGKGAAGKDAHTGLTRAESFQKAIKEGSLGPVIIDMPTTTGENGAPNAANAAAASSVMRVDGIVAASSSSYSYVVVGKDGAARLFDSDYGVGYGHYAGLVLTARQVYGDAPRVPVIRYTEKSKGVTVLDSAKPTIEVRQQKGLRHGGARSAVEKEVKSRNSAVASRDKLQAADEAKDAGHARSDKTLGARAAALQKAEASAKKAAASKAAEKMMEDEKKAAIAAKRKHEEETRRKETKLTAAQELDMQRRKDKEKKDTNALGDDLKAMTSHIREGHSISEMVHTVPAEKRITESKLKSVLKVSGEFPERHRTLIWRILLRLPENTDAYSDLVRRGVHPAYKRLSERYPLRSRRIFSRLQAVCSQLAHWAPVLADASYLPQVVFPFVVVFGNDELAALEATMTLLMWWGHSWHATHPQPPVHIMDCVDSLVYKEEPRVHAHLVQKLNMSPGVLGWVMISTMFTEVFSRQDWLRLMDFMVLHIKKVGSPLLVPVAIMNVHRNHILQCHTEEDVMSLLRNQATIDFPAVIKALAALIKSTSPKHLAAMSTGKNTKKDATFADDASIGTYATGLATNYSAKSGASGISGRSVSQGHAGYKYSEVEEALECLALSGGSPLFPLHKGRYPSYDVLPVSVVDWQLRDRHRAIMLNEADGQASSEDVLAILNSRLEQVHAEHKDLLANEDRVAQNEMARRGKHAEVEKSQLMELERIEKEISVARIEGQKKKEAAVEESMKVIDAAARETRDLLAVSEEQMKEKVKLQMLVASQREIAEKAEAETAVKIETMLARRVKEEFTRKMGAQREFEVAELEEREKVLLAENALQEEQVRVRAANKNRRIIKEKESEEFKESNGVIISSLQEMLLDRETKLQELEQERSVRMASEITLEGMSAAEMAAQYLTKQEVAARAKRDAEIAQMRSEQVTGAYSSVLTDIRTDAEHRREEERRQMIDGVLVTGEEGEGGATQKTVFSSSYESELGRDMAADIRKTAAVRFEAQERQLEAYAELDREREGGVEGRASASVTGSTYSSSSSSSGSGSSSSSSSSSSSGSVASGGSGGVADDASIDDILKPLGAEVKVKVTRK